MAFLTYHKLVSHVSLCNHKTFQVLLNVQSNVIGKHFITK